MQVEIPFLSDKTIKINKIILKFRKLFQDEQPVLNFEPVINIKYVISQCPDSSLNPNPGFEMAQSAIAWWSPKDPLYRYLPDASW